jgi:uncharacterized protein YggE
MGFKHGFLFAIGAVFALAVIFTIIGSTMAQNVTTVTNSSQYKGTITVTGTGTVYVVPDMAQVSIGVTNDAATATQAMSDNAQAMTNVINAIGQLGIASTDVKTSTVSLQPKYAYEYPTTVEPSTAYNNASSGGSSGTMIPAITSSPLIPVATTSPTVLTTQIVGYTATNMVTVTIRDLTLVGPVIDAGYNNGANQVNGVTYTLSDSLAASVYQQALQSAMTNGAAKAQTLATAAGISGIELKTISESSMYYPVSFQALEPAASADDVVSTPVSSGQNQVTATVSLTYAYPMQ